MPTISSNRPRGSWDVVMTTGRQFALDLFRSSLHEVPRFDGSSLSGGDQIRLTGELARVKDVLLAAQTRGQWLTYPEIAALAGVSEGSVGSRCRDMRKKKFGGSRVDRRRRYDNGPWEYMWIREGA